jgi:hypothetical protein
MISHKHKCIFVHINKCGGLSIDEFFTGKFQGHYFIQHYKQKWPARFEKYFKFTFVRNPWAKVLSQFWYRQDPRYHKKHRLNHPDLYKSDGSFRNMTFLDFVKKPVGIQNIPMLKWITNKKGKVLVDFIGRVETYQDDFNFVCDRLEIPRQVAPHINKSEHKHYTEYYDDETRELVAHIYAKDIEYFGYKFGE